MKIAMLTSVSPGTPWASLTTPNHAEYCLRHGYTFIARNLPYYEALADFSFMSSLLDSFDILWCLDSDAIITNMNYRVEDLSLNDGLNVCREDLHEACPINCGSIILKGRDKSNWLLNELATHESEWRPLMFVWQQWIAERLSQLENIITIHPSRTYNSCHCTDKCLWEPGDFVYHPCGIPHDGRLVHIQWQLEKIVK